MAEEVEFRQVYREIDNDNQNYYIVTLHHAYSRETGDVYILVMRVETMHERELGRQKIMLSDKIHDDAKAIRYTIQAFDELVSKWMNPEDPDARE